MQDDAPRITPILPPDWDAATEEALNALKLSAREGGNLFEALMETVQVCSLGQITEALFEVGGQYRRNM